VDGGKRGDSNTNMASRRRIIASALRSLTTSSFVFLILIFSAHLSSGCVSVASAIATGVAVAVAVVLAVKGYARKRTPLSVPIQQPLSVWVSIESCRTMVEATMIMTMTPEGWFHGSHRSFHFYR
jgi:hypothetical protein